MLHDAAMIEKEIEKRVLKGELVNRVEQLMLGSDQHMWHYPGMCLMYAKLKGLFLNLMCTLNTDSRMQAHAIKPIMCRYKQMACSKCIM